MLRKITQGLLGAMVLGIVASAHAAVSVPFGWYFEGNVGQSNHSGKYYPGSTNSKGLGESVDIGYKFSTFVAGEVGFSNYATNRIKTTAGARVADDRFYSYDIAGKLLLPIGGTGAEIFGKLGWGHMSSDLTVTDPGTAAANGMTFNPGTHSANGIYLGAGADYAVMPNVLVSLQWARQRGNHDTGNGDLYTIGLTYIV